MIILLYHGVTDQQTNQLSLWNYRSKHLSRAIFKRQLAYLKKYYNILPLDQAISHLKTSRLPPHSLSITFDDGYKNFFLEAYPIIKAREVPVTIFLTTNFVCRRVPLWTDRLEYAHSLIYTDRLEVGKKTDHNRRTQLKLVSDCDKEVQVAQIERAAKAGLRDFAGPRAVYAPLDIEDIRQMDTAPEHLIAFGPHTQSHPILTQVNLSQAREEIRGSKIEVKAMAKNFSNVMSYPNGQPTDWDDNIESISREEGFLAAVTTIPGPVRTSDNLFALRRFTMDQTNHWPLFLATSSGLRAALQSIKRKYGPSR